MGVSRTESHDDGPKQADAQGAASDEAPTGQMLVGGAVGDRCVNCGSPLAADQQYCVNCGERRGKSRFSVPGASGPTVPATSATVASTPTPGRRPSYGTTLVAGIATLLLAMGVGVEIGRISNNNNNGNSKAAAAPSVITVNGGGGASAGGATTAATGGGGATGKAQHVKKAAPAPKTEVVRAKAAASAAKPTAQAVQKASHAAASVLGGNNVQSNNTVTSGGSCKAGSAGCENGKFTGNFFGQ